MRVPSQLLKEIAELAEIQQEAMKVWLGECEICELSVTQWDADFGDMGVKYMGDDVFHEACHDGRMPVAAG